MPHSPIVFAGILAASIALGPTSIAGAAQDGIQFLDPLTNEPLELKQRPEQEITPAVAQFHETGVNPYDGDEAAIQEGEAIYDRWCWSCHLEDGSGRIGPNLNDAQWKYPRTDTDQGKFEIIYAGGAGAMQAFGDRLDQDEILKLIAFVDTLETE